MKNILFLILVALLGGCHGGNRGTHEIEFVQDSLYEAAKVYPGAVGKKEPRLKDVQIELQLSQRNWNHLKLSTAPNEWHSTGFYVPPCEMIEIEVPENIDGVVARIGSSTCNLSNKSKRVRPAITWNTFDLKPGLNKIYNALGGHLYMISDGYEGKLKLTISGVVKSPDYILGETDPIQWLEKIKVSEVPWAELRSERIILTLPVADIKEVKDPVALMEWYDDVLKQDYNDLWGVSDTIEGMDKAPFFPWRMVSDIQVCAGAAHAGYPFMAGYSWGKRAVNLEFLKNKDWGIFHELGHNYQVYCWKPSYVTEVTCNLNVIHYHNRHHRWPEGKIKYFKWAVENYANKNIKNKDFEQLANSKGPFKQRLTEMITPYIQIAQKYGWNYLTYLAKSSRNNEDEILGNGGRIDFFAERVTEYAGENLLPFFDAWGMKLSNNTRMYIKQFPTYKGEKFWTKFDENIIPDQNITREPVVKEKVEDETKYVHFMTYYSRLDQERMKEFIKFEGVDRTELAFQWYGARYFAMYYHKDTDINPSVTFTLPEISKDKSWKKATFEKGRYKVSASFRPFYCGVHEVAYNGKVIGEIDLSDKSGRDGELFTLGEIELDGKLPKNGHQIQFNYKKGGDRRLIIYSIELKKI